jgi:hypothetical protein
MQIYETFDPTPFRVNAYRTDEALFLHIFPLTWEEYIKQTRKLIYFFVLILSILLLLLFYRIVVENIMFTEIVKSVLFFAGILGLLFSCWFLAVNAHVLIRVDRNTIHITTWYFKIGYLQSINRPNKILLEKHRNPLCFITNDNITNNNVIHLPVNDHEFRWIGKLIEQFENEIPALYSNTDSNTDLNIDLKIVAHTRRILDEMQYQGQKLWKIPDPTEQYKTNKITKNKLPDELPGVLHVCCLQCNSLLPKDHVLVDTASAQCPCCGFLFEVTDLKRYLPSGDSNIELQSEENVLKLHQRPQFFGIAFSVLFSIICADIMFAVYYFYIQQNNPDVFLQEIGFIASDNNFAPLARMAIGAVIIHILSSLIFLWSIFVHRFIEFRHNEVWFRIRWLCFWWSWTIPRKNLGADRLLFRKPFFGFGIQIRYGKRSFYLGAESVEIPLIVGEINYWLLTHPPEESPISDHFPKFENNNYFSEKPEYLIIGGVDQINNKEIRWYCCDCGRQFRAEELDFPNRTALCPDCHKTFNLSQLQYYAVEKKAVKPKLPYLYVKESKTEQQIECSIMSMKGLEKYSSLIACYVHWILIAVLFLICPSFFANYFFTDILVRQPEINQIMVFFMIMIPVLLLLPTFVSFCFFSIDIHKQICQFYTAWTTRFSDGYFELTRRYKNHSETIRIECNRIVRFQRGEPIKNFNKFIKNDPPSGHFPSNLEGRGRIRNEMILTDGTIIYLPILPKPKNNCGWNDWLVNTWNEQLYFRR